MRLANDHRIIDDAEEAVSGYLSDDLDGYYPQGLPPDDPALALRQPRRQSKEQIVQQLHESLEARFHDGAQSLSTSSRPIPS